MDAPREQDLGSVRWIIHPLCANGPSESAYSFSIELWHHVVSTKISSAGGQ